MNSKDISFEKQLQIAEKKSVLSTTQVNYLISDMNRFSKYMKKIKDKNPSISSKELENKILDDFHYNLTPIIFESGFSFENYMDLNSCKFFQEHANAFDDIWKIVSSPDYEPPATNETFGDYLESYLYNIYKKKNDIYSYALYNFDSYMKSVLEDVSFSDDPDESVQIKFKKLEKYIKANYSSGLAQKELMNDLKIACLSPRYYLKVDQKYLEEDIRKELTSSIVAITSTLKETGAYANYEKVNDRNLRKFQFPEFQKFCWFKSLY